MEMLSVAFAVTFTLPERFAPEDGDRIETVGEVVSPAVAAVKSLLAARLLFASVEITE
jgi:hypothetical protein